MAIIEKEFNLDIVPGYMPPVIYVSENDAGRAYKITILNDGNVFQIPAGSTVSIDGTLEDFVEHSSKIVKRKFRDIEATLDNNKVNFIVTKDMTKESGQIRCKVKLSNENELISTSSFIIVVDQAGAKSGVEPTPSEYPDGDSVYY